MVVEDKLKEELMKETILNTLSELVLYQDKENRIMWANRASGDSVGSVPKELVGRCCYEVWHQRSEPCEECPVVKTRETGESQIAEITSPDGRVWLIRGYPVRSENGEILGVIEITLDITERKQVENALRESESKFRDLAEKSFVGIYLIQDGVLKYVNPRLAEIFGYEVEEIKEKKNVRDLTLPEDWPIVEENIRKRISGEVKSVHYVLRGTTKNKDTIWVEVYGSRTMYQGRPAVIGALLDITKRKLVDQALHLSEEKFRTMIEQSNDMIWTLDTEGSFTFFNKRCEEVSGYRFEDWQGKTFEPLILEEYIPWVIEAFRRTLNGEPQHYEVGVRKKDGEILLLSVNTAPIFMGHEVVGTVSFGRDVTEQKQAERALSEERDRARKYLDIAGVIILVIDANQKVILINKRGCDILGYEDHEIVGKNWFENFIPERERECVRDVFAKILAGEIEPVEYFENRVVARDGSEKIISWHNTLLKDEAGNIVGTLSSGEDTTERKKAEKELENLAKFPAENPYPMLRASSDGTLLYANPASEPIMLEWGCSVGESLPGNWRQLIAAALATGEIKSGVEVEHAGRSLSFTIVPITDPGYANLYGTDITESKRLETELRMKAQLLDAASDSIMLFDLEGNPVYVNEAAYRLHGYTKDELMGMNLHALDTSEQVALIEPRIRELMEKGEAVFESANYRKDGSIIPVEVHARVIESGDRKLILSAAHDITERKQAAGEIENTLQKLRRALGGTIQTIALTVETKDPYTAGHQRRVANLARAIAKEMNLSSDQIEGVRMAGVIHDIGKISVPGEILSKPGQISEVEFALIRDHPKVGHDILKTIEFPWPIAQIILQHHERMDGSGYPSGLTGQDTILEARILAVADVVEAMSSHRPYRPALTVDDALTEISKNRGILYDPDVVDACLRLFGEQKFTFDQR